MGTFCTCEKRSASLRSTPSHNWFAKATDVAKHHERHETQQARASEKTYGQHKVEHAFSAPVQNLSHRFVALRFQHHPPIRVHPADTPSLYRDDCSTATPDLPTAPNLKPPYIIRKLTTNSAPSLCTQKA